jgi:hypothetical protein
MKKLWARIRKNISIFAQNPKKNDVKDKTRKEKWVRKLRNKTKSAQYYLAYHKKGSVCFLFYVVT